MSIIINFIKSVINQNITDINEAIDIHKKSGLEQQENLEISKQL